MRYALLFTLALFGWSLGSYSADAIASPDLLKSCEAVLNVRASSETHSLEIPAAGLPCWYYMSAIQDMSTLVDQDRRPLIGVCAPSDTTLLDYIRSFVEYARQNRNGPLGNAAALAVEGLSKAFPCGAGTISSRFRKTVPSSAQDQM